MNRWGAKEPLGLNINALILFGPLISLFLNLAPVLTVRNVESNEGYFHYELFLAKRWSNWTIVFISGLLLAILFVYLIGENCR
ncbi:MAG: hypothetical protein ICV66_13895 [Chitinophagaceae bacterium]|nr:hypothetical protein [Chitinophagaceae bacterium]